MCTLGVMNALRNATIIKCVTFVACQAASKRCRRRFSYKQLYNLNAMPLCVVYPSLDSVLSVLYDEKYKDDVNVAKLIKLYSDAEKCVRHVKRNHPLIVLEGLDLSGKTTLSRLLAEKINGASMSSPPNCIPRELRVVFDEHEDLRTAFYTLANYMCSVEVLHALEERPVVLDRFWYSTAANSLAQTISSNPKEYALPPRGNPVYRWPADLLQPDVVLFLSVSEKVRQGRQELREQMNGCTKNDIMLRDNHAFRQNILLAYQYMEEPAIKLVRSDGSIEESLQNVLRAIEHIIPV